MTYSPKMDRRTTLKWLVTSVGLTPVLANCAAPSEDTGETLLLGEPKPIAGAPYGVDPDLMDPKATWDRTLTPAQLQLSAALCDVIMPGDDGLPSASMLGVPDFVDEWVSSPYEQSQGDRTACFALLEWLEAEARSSGAASFEAATLDQKRTLLDRVAWQDRVEPGLETYADGFARFRTISVSAYLASAEGSSWLGYIGNQPAMGDYAGPTQDALEHLQASLEPLGLSVPTGL